MFQELYSSLLSEHDLIPGTFPLKAQLALYYVVCAVECMVNCVVRAFSPDRSSRCSFVESGA